MSGVVSRGDQADRIACEDVIMFVNAAMAATGQREFRSSSEAQRMSLDFLHDYVLGNYRDLYASTLALDINHHNTAMIAFRLLQTTGDATAEQRAVEGRLISARLRTLPPQRVYALFRELCQRRVNNRRTRAIVRDWLASRPDLAFDAVKYRRSLAAIARHHHLPLPEEVGDFLFGGLRTRRHYQTPILASWRRAHYDRRALYDLPYTVAEGFAGRLGIDRTTFLSGIAPKLTQGERLRLQQSAQRHQATGIHSPDLAANTSLTRLASYTLSLSEQERIRRRDELTGALRAAAGRVARRQSGTWGRVVAVLDDSYSAVGSLAKRRRPLAVALATHYLLEQLATEYTGLWLGHRGDPLLVRPIGPSNLGERILDGLACRPDRLIVVSDGWDNSPPGLAAEVLRVWYTILDPDRRTSVVHLNPVYDADTFDTHRLAPGLATIGVRDAEDAPTLVELARFAAGEAGIDQLRRYLADRVGRFLHTQGGTS